MDFIGFLAQHGEKALFRVVGMCSTSSPAESSIESFEPTGRTQVSAVPTRELLFQMVVLILV